jgi:pimeloyl-ACP methyl ester carboxylesterase
MEAAARERLLRSHGDRGAAEETVRQIAMRALSPEAFERCVEDQLASAPALGLVAGTRQPGGPFQPDRADASAGPRYRQRGRSRPAGICREGRVMPHLAEARVATLDGAGHLMPLEAPDEVAELIGFFVARCRPGQRTGLHRRGGSCRRGRPSRER